MKLAIHFHIFPKLKLGGAEPTLSHTPSWRGAKLWGKYHKQCLMPIVFHEVTNSMQCSHSRDSRNGPTTK